MIQYEKSSARVPAQGNSSGAPTITVMKRGRTLELVIARLEKVLCGREGVTIESPYRVRDKTNQRHQGPREHDVAIIQYDTHHELVIALECRDRSRPVGREHVEAFSRKCQDTGVHKGVIVSTKGFRKSALEKARFLEIECLSLEEVAQFTWFVSDELPQWELRTKNQHWHFHVRPADQPVPKGFIVVDETGKEISTDVLRENVQNALRQKPEVEFNPGIYKRHIKFEIKDCYLMDQETGRRRKVTHADTTVEFEIVKKVSPVRKVRYAKEETGELIAEVAVMPITLGPLDGEFMLVKNNDALRLVYSPRQHLSAEKSKPSSPPLLDP